jgi:xylulokinase
VLRAEAAAELGLPGGVPVAGGGGDNAAAAVGVGAVAPGQGFVSLGTSGVVFVAGDRFAPAPQRAVHAFCHALPGRWHQMAVILSAAAALDWAVRLTGFADAATAVAAAEAHVGPVPVFLPYLSGERTPHNDPRASGVVFGLSHDAGPAALVRAVLEGVAFALADGADVLREAGGAPEALIAVGGGARSRFWLRLIATALRTPLSFGEGAETGPALGAARLARLVVTGEAAGGVCTPPPGLSVVEPDVALAEGLARRRDTYRRLYPDLRASFAEN